MGFLFSTNVTIIKNAGQPDESRGDAVASIQSKVGYFPKTTPIDEGDIVEAPDPRAGRNTRRLPVSKVEIFDVRSGGDHIKVEWGRPSAVREAPIRRLGLEGLHPEILKSAGDLFTDGHLADAIFNAFKCVELRVKKISGIDGSGKDLMAKAFAEAAPAIVVAIEEGRTGRDEQEGTKFLFMGAAIGIRNPKAHGDIQQTDPQRTLEYLAFASLLMRRLDDALAME